MHTPPAAPTFLLFSGHSDRAVVALCRFFRRHDLAFVILATGRDDAIHRTAYADAVLLNRTDAQLSLDLLLAPVGTVRGPLVYCPTTEFINDFVLAQRTALSQGGLQIDLPEAPVYAALTGKLASQSVVARLVGLQPPPNQTLAQARAPCVLKPRHNLQAGRVLYPRLCLDAATLARERQGLSETEWFAQDYICGQSHYLCGYLARDGRRAWFWQDNLMQQPGGKSIVFARTGANPGLDADRLFNGLADMGYHGPFMMELIADAHGVLHYIEINPRFWGPLQLALDACPALLTLYAQDSGASLPDAPSPAPGPHWYAWAHGAGLADCRRYPAADALPAQPDIQTLLQRHDVYAAADTRALQHRH